MSDMVFYILAASLCAFAILCVTVKDVFHSAVYLALSLLCVAGLFCSLDAVFLGVVQILVYVGGIMTLFVFAIMLTAKIGDKTIRQVNQQYWPAALISGAFMIVLVEIVHANKWNSVMQPQGRGLDLRMLGKTLLTAAALPFEFISLLLLAALVGAIVIGKVKK